MTDGCGMWRVDLDRKQDVDQERDVDVIQEGQYQLVWAVYNDVYTIYAMLRYATRSDPEIRLDANRLFPTCTYTYTSYHLIEDYTRCCPRLQEHHALGRVYSIPSVVLRLSLLCAHRCHPARLPFAKSPPHPNPPNRIPQ